MKFELKKWHLDYIEDVVRFASNQKIADNLRNAFPYPYTTSDAQNYVAACAKNDEKRQICRAIVVDGHAVGSIGIFLKDDVYCKSGEIGYWLAQEYWNRGIMSSAIRMLCQEAFEKYPVVRIFAEPYAHNIASRKALEKAGFMLEGIMKNSVFKNGQLYDSCMYALLK